MIFTWPSGEVAAVDGDDRPADALALGVVAGSEVHRPGGGRR
ncbi:hypothetical protein [Streptomyces sp. NPDC088746]